MEKELVLHKKIAEEQKERGNKLETDLDDWRIRAQGERKSADEVSSWMCWPCNLRDDADLLLFVASRRVC